MIQISVEGFKPVKIQKYVEYGDYGRVEAQWYEFDDERLVVGKRIMVVKFRGTTYDGSMPVEAKFGRVSSIDESSRFIDVVLGENEFLNIWSREAALCHGPNIQDDGTEYPGFGYRVLLEQ